jgi:hypothetical protein
MARDRLRVLSEWGSVNPTKIVKEKNLAVIILKVKAPHP